MNFEKVELYGFKSFADKAEIKFGNGITCIVGPNGCGKSNVADAVRWVLGEQSAKTLRGTSMQDVIFNGTQNRKSLSYCEVSLYFDNSNKMFSLDYNEVIITRKLYRDGNCEYFINKQPARLKDIVDLLHECGIGKEGYTIIGQGKVEEIMSAKPEVRRLIFEEATGIAKFKTRKNESERKLERTHENLLRYCDILSEIENQLAPLEKQAEKAKEYNILTEELKKHELNTYIYKVEGVAEAKARIDSKIKGLDEEFNLRQSEYEKVLKEYENILSEINNADDRLRTLNNDLLDKRVNMEKSSGAQKLFEEKITYLQGQIERSKKEIEQGKEFVNECKNLIKNNIEECEKDKKEVRNLEKQTAELALTIKKLTEQINLGEELSGKIRKEFIESIESLSDVRMNKGTLSVEKKNYDDKLKELIERLDGYSVKRNDLFNIKEKIDQSIDELDRSVFEIKNKITEKEDEVRECNENVAKNDNLIYTLNSTITALNTKDAFYQSFKESYEGYAPAVKVLMGKAKENAEIKKRIKGVVAEIIKSDKKYDIALETALAAGAQNIITSNPDDAKFLIEYLKVNRLGRITFLPITSARPRPQSEEVTLALRERGAIGVADKLVTYNPEYYNVISNLLGNTLIVDNIQNATEIAKKYHFNFKIVTLDGDVFSTQGSITGGVKKNDVIGLLSSDRRIEENAENLKNKNAEMDVLKAKKAELEKRRDKALDELSVLNDLYNSKRQDVATERQKQEATDISLSEVNKEIENVNELIDTIKERIKEVSKDFDSATSGLNDLEKHSEKARADEDKHHQEFEALRKQRDELNENYSSILLTVSELRAKIDGYNADKERLVNSVSDTEKNEKSILESIDGANAMIEELRLEEEKVSLSKEEKEIVDKLHKDIDDIENYKIELRDKLKTSGERRDYLSEEINTITDKKHNQEIELTKIDSDLEYMGQSILENYQENYETAQKYRIENYDVKEGESLIVQLRKKRSSLGAINATAIEDCQILKERYNEMTTQKEDLEKAEKDLNEAIDKIKTEMLTQFDQGFNKINENFQRIFKELFGGGRAMLQMDYTQVDDKLEAGVEIVAEPPGKRLQNLSLLSGGEKALTAIAILFAILKMRPMPFCILDEIEAALDEANVDRFARYLQKYSNETQFIVITHRKPTMEMADSLFGVTMQEKGVSKTVSVKLSDVAEITGEQLA